MTKFILYYDPASIVDIKEFYKEYNYESTLAGKHEPRLKQGAPLLQNVEGSYIKQSDIRKLTYNTYSNNKDYNEYFWVRDNSGRVTIYRKSTN